MPCNNIKRTEKTYGKNWDSWTSWCNRCGSRPDKQLYPLPAWSYQGLCPSMSNIGLPSNACSSIWNIPTNWSHYGFSGSRPLLGSFSHAWLSRCRLDSWPKLQKLGVRSDVGLGLSICAVPLLQFRSQRSEEVGLECWSKVVAWTLIKIVIDEEGTNSRHWKQEEFVPNRQEDVEHNEETRSGSIVNKSGYKLIFKLKYRRVNKGYYTKGKTVETQCSRATRVPSGGNTASEEPKIWRSERG